MGSTTSRATLDKKPFADGCPGTYWINGMKNTLASLVEFSSSMIPFYELIDTVKPFAKPIEKGNVLWQEQLKNSLCDVAWPYGTRTTGMESIYSSCFPSSAYKGVMILCIAHWSLLGEKCTTSHLWQKDVTFPPSWSTNTFDCCHHESPIPSIYSFLCIKDRQELKKRSHHNLGLLKNDPFSTVTSIYFMATLCYCSLLCLSVEYLSESLLSSSIKGITTTWFCPSTSQSNGVTPTFDFHYYKSKGETSTVLSSRIPFKNLECILQRWPKSSPFV